MKRHGGISKVPPDYGASGVTAEQPHELSRSKPISSRRSQIRAGDSVLVQRVPSGVASMPRSTKRVFRLSVGRQFKVRSRNRASWLELHVGRVVGEPSY